MFTKDFVESRGRFLTLDLCVFCEFVFANLLVFHHGGCTLRSFLSLMFVFIAIPCRIECSSSFVSFCLWRCCSASYRSCTSAEAFARFFAIAFRTLAVSLGVAAILTMERKAFSPSRVLGGIFPPFCFVFDHPQVSSLVFARRYGWSRRCALCCHCWRVDPQTCHLQIPCSRALISALVSAVAPENVSGA